MSLHRIRLIAVILAVLGQCVTAFGVSAIRIGRPEQQGLSPCGCSATDREAGRCCCVQNSTSTCCDYQAEPELAVPSCCQSKAKQKCSTSQIHWQNPVLKHHCKGPDDPVTANSEAPSVPPSPPINATAISEPCGRVLLADLDHFKYPVSPDDRPPRLA